MSCMYTHSKLKHSKEGTVHVHIYMANVGGPLPGVHLLYELQTARAHEMDHAEHFGANG